MFGALNKAQVDQTLGDISVFSGRSDEGDGVVLGALPWPAMSGESVYLRLYTYGSGFWHGWAVSFCRYLRGVLVRGEVAVGDSISEGRVWAFSTLGRAASGEPLDTALVVQSYKNNPFTLTPRSLSSVFLTFCVSPFQKIYTLRLLLARREASFFLPYSLRPVMVPG